MPIEDLNPEQLQAVRHDGGPALVLAGAGSGKTRVLTNRIAYLIEQGIEPQNILAVTFTNKAANEMKERVEQLVGRSKIWSGTFHSICVRILRVHADKLFYNRSFNIYDDQDSKKLVKDIMKELELVGLEGKRPKEVLKMISELKTRMIEPEHAAEEVSDAVAEVYRVYQNRLRRSDCMDFDDLLCNTVKLLRIKEVREYYQNKFQHILIDEYQDVNHAQYLLAKTLADKHENIFVVGDDFQCWSKNGIVSTPNGNRTISELNIGDKVLCSYRNEVKYSEVTNKAYSGEQETLSITTKSGKTLTVTKNHKCFATLPPFDDYHYVYLMYRKDKGFRIGVTSGGKTSSIRNRTASERAERLWLLKQTKSLDEAHHYETYLSLKYQIPTCPFYNNGRGIRTTQESLDKIFNEFGKNGFALLEDVEYSFDYPHFIPQATVRHNISRKNVYITMNTRDGVQVRYQSGNTRIRKHFKSYKKATQYAHNIKEEHDCDIIFEKFSGYDRKTIYLIPASQLFIGMEIPVNDNGELSREAIVNIELNEPKDVYDIEVAEAGNLIVDDVVSHNSIYGFRGADITNILSFERDYPNAEVYRLEQNYRSTKNIIAAANAVIANNPDQKEKELWTQNKEGDKVSLNKLFAEHDEAAYVVNTIYKIRNHDDLNFGWNDFAVLYRTNTQSRKVEEVLVRNRIPYEVVGGTNFYERMEIKDITAYLKALSNKKDDVSMKRIINTPSRGIGKTTQGRLENFAKKEGISFWEAVLRHEEVKSIKRGHKKIEAFIELIRSFNEDNYLTELAEDIVDRSGYREYWSQKGPEGLDRLNNVDELLNMIEEYEGLNPGARLQDLLQELALVSDVDKLDEDAQSVKLMTLHNAKGLEFPVVFLIGMEEGLLPHGRSIRDEDIDEERRLFYVGVTRAQEKLYLTYAQTRSFYGQDAHVTRTSRFLDEIPEDLIRKEW